MNKRDIEPKPFCIQPSPQTIITCRSKSGKDNALSVSFVANASIEKPMVMIGIVPTRYSYSIIKESKCFVVNIPTENLRETYYYLGSVSGKDENKIEKSKLTKKECNKINCFYIEECPICLECEVVASIMPGSHELFIGELKSIHCKEDLLDMDNNIMWDKLKLL